MSDGSSDVIDAHRHFGSWGPYEISGKVVDPFRKLQFESAEAIKQAFQKDHVAHAVVVPMYSHDPHSPFALNGKLLDIRERIGGLLIPGLWVDPSPEVRSDLRASLKQAQDHGVFVLKTSASAWCKGYSLDPATWDTAFRRGLEIIVEYLQQVRGILQLHTGSGKSDIRLVEKMLYSVRPEFTVHLVHMGRSVSGHFYLLPRLQEWIDDSLDIVCDTSCSCGFAIRWLLQEFNRSPVLADRVMFASDEPWGIFDSEMAKITRVFGTEESLQSKILYDNAYRLYIEGRAK